MPLDLLLADAADAKPVLKDSLPEDVAFRAPKPDLRQPKFMRSRTRDLDNLAVQRWALVITDDDHGERLKSLVAPLQALRQEEQGAAEIRVYKVRPGMDELETIQWRQEKFEVEPEEELPLYLLILGDLDGVSLAFQQVMSTDSIVGRLAFPSDDGYSAYVEKVLRWQKAPYAGDTANALFYTARDGSQATTVGYNGLHLPSLRRCRERQQNGLFRAKSIVEIVDPGDPSPDALLEQARRREPSVLFSISHGLGPPRGRWGSVDEQRALQGAMSFGPSGKLTGQDVTKGDFLPGGVWFFLACYGAGTPSESAYRHWLSKLRDAGAFSGRLDAVVAGLPKPPNNKPFIAALPQAALANPYGPLAVMAHVDLAWTYAFQDAGASPMNRAERFQGIFWTLLAGRRAGIAHKELMLSGTQAAVDLSLQYGAAETSAPSEADAARALKRANLWMLRHDLLGYIFLGDPAVRLPLSTAAPAKPKRDPSSFMGFAVKAAAAARSGPVDVSTKDKAVRAALREDRSLAEVAKKFEVDKADLETWIDAYTRAGRAALEKL